ncbi:hypothetical protein JCM10369A_18020 [Nocardioides pyridinolyticus]
MAYIRSTRTRKPRVRSGTSRTSGVGSSNIPANISRPAFAISVWSNARSAPALDTPLFLFRFFFGTPPANQTARPLLETSGFIQTPAPYTLNCEEPYTLNCEEPHYRVRTRRADPRV